MAESLPIAEAFPLLWSDDPGAIADWAVAILGLSESWRATGDNGITEHVELHWHPDMGGGKISLNIKRDPYTAFGPSGISLRIDDRTTVVALHERAVAAGASIVQGPEESRIAYSFTTIDPDGNHWWVNAETGLLDQLRDAPTHDS